MQTSYLAFSAVAREKLNTKILKSQVLPKKSANPISGPAPTKLEAQFGKTSEFGPVARCIWYHFSNRKREREKEREREASADTHLHLGANVMNCLSCRKGIRWRPFGL
jgi:hypothetical protein